MQYAYKAWDGAHPKASGPCQPLVQVCVHQNNRGIIWQPACFHKILKIMLHFVHRLGRGHADQQLRPRVWAQPVYLQLAVYL